MSWTIRSQYSGRYDVGRPGLRLEMGVFRFISKMITDCRLQEHTVRTENLLDQYDRHRPGGRANGANDPSHLNRSIDKV